MTLYPLLFGTVLGLSAMTSYANPHNTALERAFDRTELAVIHAQERRLDRAVERREQRMAQRRDRLRSEYRHHQTHHQSADRGINVGVKLPFVGAGASVNRHGVQVGANVGRINVGAGVNTRR
ncbi:MAG: hypothetical protein WA154_01950 [Moraxellaceae bacterium]